MRTLMKGALLGAILPLLALAGASSAAPLTDPDDPRSWQGANVETFRALFGFATRQDVIDAGLLDDGQFPNTVDYAATFTRPEVACGSHPAGLNSSLYVGGVQGAAGFSTSPTDYGYVTVSNSPAEYAAAGRCLDMWWIQDLGDGDLTSGNVWDLGGPSNQVAVFPVVDHGPLPQEAIEYTVYLSNNPSATEAGTDGNTHWVLAKIDRVYLEGWITTWIADGFTTVWRLPGGQTFRYANVVAGGVGSLIHDGDDEIDTVIGLTAGGEVVCPKSSDRDGDGVCDEDDNCPDVANPLQEDSDKNGIGDVCDGCSEANIPADFDAPTPDCGSVIPASTGGAVTFTVAASDPDKGDLVTLSVSGLPAGATFTPPLPTSGNPVSSNFAWTPGAKDVGDHAIILRAADPCGGQSECTLTIRVRDGDNAAPDCSQAVASTTQLWPPSHRLVPIEVLGVVDPDGDPVTIIVTGVTQDESVDAEGDGSTCPDATLIDGRAQVRSERSGQGNGRVYRLSFVASDGRGGACEGIVSVCVPHDQGRGATCVDDGSNYDSLDDCKDDADDPELRVIRLDGGVAQLEYELLEEADVTLAVYDVAGRRVATLEQGRQPAGTRSVTWDGARLRHTVYFVQLRVGTRSVVKRVFFP